MPTKGVSRVLKRIEVMAGPPEWGLSCTPRSYESATSHGFFLMYYGPEFTAHAVREWLDEVDVDTLFIEPGSPWENGYVESFNGKFRDELLNGEIFYTLQEAQVIIERWRREYNTFRPHSALGYRPPAPETVQWPWPKNE